MITAPSRPFRIEGFVIISADGMIADADGVMPDTIKSDADQQLFQESLDRVAAVVHGRHSHEGGPNAGRRHRLVATRQTAASAPNPDFPRALSWNPAGASINEAWRALGVGDGILAVLGGTDIFGLFLSIGYDAFHISRANRVRLPGGRPVFPQVGPRVTPEHVLSAHGLEAGPMRVLDPVADVTLVTWRRSRVPSVPRL